MRAQKYPLFLSPVLCILGGCTEGIQGILTARGPIAASDLQLLWEALATMLLVVVPVIALTLAVAWWFRASNTRATHRPTWAYSGKIEFSIWMIPFLIVLFLGTLAWVGAHDLDPYRPYAPRDNNRAPVNVEVVSLDWKWLFIYPDLGVASVNELVVPANTPVHLKLTSATVMNSFFVPGWAGQIYTMATMQTQLSFLVTDPGEAEGLSAQFSGDGFSDMHFRAVAANDASFARWIQDAKAAPLTLTRSAYDNLVSRHQAENVIHFAGVDPELFRYILRAPGERLPAPAPLAAR